MSKLTIQCYQDDVAKHVTRSIDGDSLRLRFIGISFCETSSLYTLTFQVLND